MSCYTVTQAHIDALVLGAVAHHVVTDLGEDLVALGQALWAENYASVNTRYNESTPVPTYTADGLDHRLVLDPVGLAKNVRCYEYQCTESPTWPTSLAAKLCLDLIATLCSTVGGGDLSWPYNGEYYDGWPYGIDTSAAEIAAR